ncbi:hypothetical protein DM01DRAFT_1338772 [Hesseltinella vesiculosa]|uniref:RRM domain-containing protein n=1 Tax=Hesseltinella vesiculosa TaxID=101127 RepID=A0A1X2GAG3_9FUNG|nr:hypothetical protein DM01DRAFT_1338772 [Hesseltinella vesiculosa]
MLDEEDALDFGELDEDFELDADQIKAIDAELGLDIDEDLEEAAPLAPSTNSNDILSSSLSNTKSSPPSPPRPSESQPPVEKRTYQQPSHRQHSQQQSSAHHARPAMFPMMPMPTPNIHINPNFKGPLDFSRIQGRSFQSNNNYSNYNSSSYNHNSGNFSSSNSDRRHNIPGNHQFNRNGSHSPMSQSSHDLTRQRMAAHPPQKRSYSDDQLATSQHVDRAQPRPRHMVPAANGNVIEHNGLLSIRGAANRTGSASPPAVRNKYVQPYTKPGFDQSRLRANPGPAVPRFENGKANKLILSNVAAGISKASLQSLDPLIKDIQMEANKNQASVLFTSIDEAVQFRRKYNRFLFHGQNLTVTFAQK